ncbi:MAG: hypothetical protein U5K71_08030 [Gracilimonas sp.]|nr:hypothetical protein [Gracilimonas sp.]
MQPRLAGTAEEPLLNDLNTSLNNFVQVETKFNELRSEFESARSQGNISRQREIRSELNQMNEDAQEYLTQVRTVRQSLTLVQYAYYMADQTEKAEQLATEINSLMGPDFPAMPASKEESESEINRYGLGIE